MGRSVTFQPTSTSTSTTTNSSSSLATTTMTSSSTIEQKNKHIAYLQQMVIDCMLFDIYTHHSILIIILVKRKSGEQNEALVQKNIRLQQQYSSVSSQKEELEQENTELKLEIAKMNGKIEELRTMNQQLLVQSVNCRDTVTAATTVDLLSSTSSSTTNEESRRKSRISFGGTTIDFEDTPSNVSIQIVEINTSPTAKESSVSSVQIELNNDSNNNISSVIPYQPIEDVPDKTTSSRPKRRATAQIKSFAEPGLRSKLRRGYENTFGLDNNDPSLLFKYYNPEYEHCHKRKKRKIAQE
jgi:FtsZ-binding cell division protein ZapB